MSFLLSCSFSTIQVLLPNRQLCIFSRKMGGLCFGKRFICNLGSIESTTAGSVISSPSVARAQPVRFFRSPRRRRRIARDGCPRCGWALPHETHAHSPAHQSGSRHSRGPSAWESSHPPHPCRSTQPSMENNTGANQTSGAEWNPPLPALGVSVACEDAVHPGP